MKNTDTDRTVTLCFTQDEYAEVETSTDAKALQAAIGYFTTWAMGSDRYTHCKIFINAKESEVTAVYRAHLDGPVTYCIGAIWHNTHFGFHS